MAEVKKFYAVTTTNRRHVSVYSVERQYGRSSPFVQKIGMRGRSAIPLGGLLPTGYFVGIRPSGLIIYGTDNRAELENVDATIRTRSSPIVALFLNEETALKCMDSGELKFLDPRWRKQTEEVLQAIGPDHPMFVLSETDPIKYE